MRYPECYKAAQKPSIRIRVCLQAYRKSLKMSSAFSRWGSMFPM
jgi:hypothetical protein